MRGLRIRLLGDRVPQNVAWKAAGLLGWLDTFDAEYVALTQLHADALITLDRHLGGGPWDVIESALDSWARTLWLCLILFVAAAGQCLAAVAAVLIRHIWLYGPAMRRHACGLGPAPSFGDPLGDKHLTRPGIPAQ